MTTTRICPVCSEPLASTKRVTAIYCTMRCKETGKKRLWRMTPNGKAAIRKCEGERRARLADAPSDGHTKQELWESYEARGLEGCSLSTHPECTGTYDEDEHIIPLCRGGGHTVGNLRPVCMTCNRGVGGKHSKTPAEVEGFQGVWPTKEQRHGYEAQSSAAA